MESNFIFFELDGYTYAYYYQEKRGMGNAAMAGISLVDGTKLYILYAWNHTFLCLVNHEKYYKKKK